MRDKIIGGIAILWGGGNIVSWLYSSMSGSPSYEMGKLMGLVIGVLMLIIGIRIFFRKPPRDN